MAKRLKDDFNIPQEERMDASSNVIVEEVGWSWKRKALQRCKASINLYVRFNIIDDIKRELQIIGGGVYQEFENSCFGRFLQFHWEGYNNAALHALIAQEITKVDAPADEIWFRVGEQCIRFSKYEYALVTGLRFGDSAFDFNAPHDPTKGGVYGRLLQCEGRLVLDDLRDRFSRGEFRHSPADALKVAKVLFVYYMLFGLDGRQTSVERWVWALVEDPEQWESFPWGKYSFQILLHYIHGLPVRLRLPQPGRRRPPSYHFYGCSFALLIWGCEAIPLLGSTCGSRVSTDQLPRCLRWTFRKMSVDMTDFFFNQMMCFSTLEPSIDEQKQIYWQHIDEDLHTGIQYVHRDTRFKRLMSTVVLTHRPQSSTSSTGTNTAAPGQRPRISRIAATSIALIPDQRSQTLRSIVTTTATPISSQRPQKRHRIDLSNSDDRYMSHIPNNEARNDLSGAQHHDDTEVVRDGNMLTFVREEVSRLERRIPEIIREELRHLFPNMGMNRKEQPQEDYDRGNFFDVPIDPPTTDTGHVPAVSITPVAHKTATFTPPPDSTVISGEDATTTSAPPPDSSVTSGADTATTSAPPPDSAVTSGADTTTTSTYPPDTSATPVTDPLNHRWLPETDASKACGGELLGCKLKVWRHKSKMFSEGVVASYNRSHKKHLEVCANRIEELSSLRKHKELAEGISNDHAQKTHSRAHDLSYMCADDDTNAHVHVAQKHKGQPIDLKSHSTSPKLCKDHRMENVEAGIAPFDYKLQAISGDDNAHSVIVYRVKASATPILEAIFDRHGDIAARCIYKSPSIRASLLEVVCNVVQRLQHDDVEAILSDVEVIENELSDVEASKIEVSWLHEHLAELHKIVPFREKSIELRKTKAKGDIVAKAAANELKERHTELLLAQKRFKEAERCVNALALVSRKIVDDIAESKSEEYLWRRRLEDLV